MDAPLASYYHAMFKTSPLQEHPCLSRFFLNHHDVFWVWIQILKYTGNLLLSGLIIDIS